MRKLIISLSLCTRILMLVCISMSTSVSSYGQNHNPEFKVSETFLEGEPYIFIGEDDDQVSPNRTPVELKYREEAPATGRTGTTTLEWTSGREKVDSYDSQDGQAGVKDGDGQGEGETDGGEDGKWTWEGDTEQENYEGKTIYLQGKTAAASGDNFVATLKSSHSEDTQENSFEKEFTLLPVEVNEVGFGGDKYWELWADSSGVSQESKVTADDKFSAPQYVDANGDGDVDDQDEKNHPVAYTRNTKPKIKVELKISGAANLGAIKIKADGSDGVVIPETAATVSGDTVSIPLTESTTAFPNTIKFYDKEDDAKAFKLDWQIKVGNSGWSSIGETKHTLHVTLADPLTSLRQETLFTIACRPSDGKTQETEIVDAIWSELSNCSVERVGTQGAMKYWGPNSSLGVSINPLTGINTSFFNTAGLLKNGDGRCGSWREFFVDLGKVHGIDSISEVDRFSPTPSAQEVSQLISDTSAQNISNVNYLFAFFVKNWTAPTGDPWSATDTTGVKGQGNDDPRSIFNDHAICSYNNKIYDPSYGLVHDSLVKWEDNSIDGFGAGVTGVDNVTLQPFEDEYWFRADVKGTVETQ